MTSKGFGEKEKMMKTPNNWKIKMKPPKNNNFYLIQM